jgi:tetratricopeptide (TPR) repeat protein
VSVTAPLDLSRTLLVDEILRARRDRWSGVLALRQVEVSKGLYFVEGEIAFAASTLEEDRLGAMLYRSGKISEAQFRGAMKAAEETGQPLGHALVAAGVLTREERQEAVRAQVERVVLSVLRWTSGELRRGAMDRPIPPELSVNLDTPRVLLLGMRQFPDVARLEREIGPPERVLRRASRAPFDYDSMPFTPAERVVLALCLKPTPVDDLLDQPHPRAELVRAIAALVGGGLLQEVPPGADASAAPADVVGSARSSLEKGDRRRALEILRGGLDATPEAPGARRLLAMLLAHEGGFDPAVEGHFLTVLATNPDDVELRYALGSYYRRSGLNGRALMHLRLVLSADPSHAAAWRDLGELEAGAPRG